MRKNYDAEFNQRIKEQGVKLKDMPDRELMNLYEKIYDNPDKEDAALIVASYQEVHRRFVAAGWIWKRWINRREYEKWKNWLYEIKWI